MTMTAHDRRASTAMDSLRRGHRGPMCIGACLDGLGWLLGAPSARPLRATGTVLAHPASRSSGAHLPVGGGTRAAVSRVRPNEVQEGPQVPSDDHRFSTISKGPQVPDPNTSRAHLRTQATRNGARKAPIAELERIAREVERDQDTNEEGDL
jgi:hypothetical protein